MKENEISAQSAAAKPKSAKSLANDESKREMFSKPAAVRACKTAFDIDGGATRKFIYGLGFTAQTFKAITADDLDVHSKSGTRFCTWEVLGAFARYAKEHDLLGEKAAKEQRKAERAAAAAARKRIEEQKRAEREKAAAERERKAAQHIAVAKAADATKAADAAAAKAKADAKAARRLAKRNK